MTASSTGTASADHIRALAERVESALERLDLPEEPRLLYDPARYALRGGGKRIRPLLLLLAAEAYGASIDDAVSAALSVEVFHNFTLLHDDIMDRAPTRRGRPTVHVKWDSATAILAGDYLMALSYRLLAQSRRDLLPDLFQSFSEMVQALCEGQALDKAFESRSDVALDEYMRMIDAKTGALIRTALELGGVIGGAPLDERRKLRAIGSHLGRAFQIQDDLLDLVADDARWGKQLGSDLIEGKKTFLLLRSLERTDHENRAFFERLVQGAGIAPEQVPEARDRMQAAGVVDEARREVDLHAREALALIGALEAPPRPREALAAIVREIHVRVR